MRPLLLLLGLLLLPLAAAQPLVLDLKQDRVEVTPPETITLAAHLMNQSSGSAQAVLSVELPAGWRLLLPPPTLSLSAGEERVLLLPLSIPQQAPAGRHEVLVEATSGAAIVQATAVVAVAAVHAVDVSVEQSPGSTLPEAYEITYRVTNRGNQQEAVSLAASSNRGVSVVSHPSTLTLAAGASALVRVTVPELRNLDRPVPHAVTLTVAPSLPGRWQPIKRTAMTEVVAIAQPARLAYHTFPIELNFELAGTTDFHDEHGLALERVGISGQGKLRENSPTTVAVHAQYSPTPAEQELTLSLTTNDHHLLIGQQKQSAGTLLPTADGFGVSLRTNGRSKASIYGLATRKGLEVGYALTPPPVRGATFTLQGAFGARTALTSLHGSFPTPLPDGGRLALSITPALDLHSLATAVNIEGVARGPGYSIRGVFEHRGTNYDGQSEPATELGGASRIQLAPGWTVDAQHYSLAKGELSKQKSTAAVLGHGGDWRWGVRYYTERNQLADLMDAESSVTAHVGVSHHSRDLGVSLAHVRPLNKPALLRGSITAAMPLAHGTAQIELKPEYDLSDRSFSSLYGRLGWQGPWGSDVTAGLRLGHNFMDSRDTTVTSSITYGSGGGPTVSFHSELRTSETERVVVEGTVSARVPLDLKLGRRPGVEAVTGRVSGPTSIPTEGLLVSLAGFTALTDREGVFAFPAIPAGEHRLFIQGLSPDLVTVPEPPLIITAPATSPVDIGVFKAATVRGTVRVDLPDTSASSRGRVEGQGEAPTLEGQQVILEGAGGRHLATTNSRGDFEIPGLPPGTWTASLVPGTIPIGYEVTPAQQEVNTSAGEVTELDFRVSPVKRSIRFTGGGYLN